MEPTKATFTISTAASEHSPSVKTVFTVIYDDAENERALATRQAVIAWQTGARRNGIPAAAVVKMSDLTPGKRRVEVVTLDTERERAKQLNADEKRKLAAEILASLETGQ